MYSHASDWNPATICPPSEVIEPCSCYRFCQECYSNIQCKNIYDLEIMSRVLDESSDYQYVGFSLKQSSLMYLPEPLFDAKQLRYLAIKESTLRSLFDAKPNVAPQITYMILDKVRLLGGIQWDLLSGFTNLKRLILFHTRVTKIGESFVEYAPKSLEEVKINNCSTARIHDEGFASLPNLLEVYVMSGRIKELKRSMFPKPSKLKSFNFSWNRLSSLPLDIFSEMPDLMYVYLGGNDLKEMPGTIFAPVFPKLLVFHFDGNPLKCRCNISWITGTGKHLEPRNFLGACHEPKNLQGRHIRDLVAEDFFHCFLFSCFH
ncbi:hypothetical protein JTE90_002988 [Oedothorax gibbosus]|uniref:Uncharacterized protein n=1 Tax=Oedothorax gibbosus TaxID=931172 RepID=A0AAV6VGQ9_9ARAC|nr:hypothetical protein JTE90_002988 [Oedothorax gibbosus]